MEVTRASVADLVEDPSNVRTHSDRNIEAIKGSLTRFGQQKPIVVTSENVVVAGNGTLRAARALGWTEIDVAVTDLEGVDLTAFGIADNRTAELATWDVEALTQTLGALPEDAREASGWGEGELPEFEGPGGVGGSVEIEEDDPGAAPDEKDAVTRPGELILLGEHRVLCGDSASPSSVAMFMDGEKPDVVFTDPPYGIAFKAMRRDDLIAMDRNEGEARKVVTDAFAFVFQPSALFVCCNWRCIGWIADCMVHANMAPKACIVWDKQRTVQNLDRYGKQHELILYSGPYGGEKTVASDVWSTARDFEPDHPTPKPVALVAKALTTSGASLVYDPFLGSGTTLIAAEQLGRRCYGMEISPAYCDVIVNRWETLTGKKVERIAPEDAAANAPQAQ